MTLLRWSSADLARADPAGSGGGYFGSDDVADAAI